MKNTIEITNGPSREELFDGLRLFAEKRLVPFSFKMNGKEKLVAVIVNSIQAEDGSGHSWNLAFLINNDLVLEPFFDKPAKNEPYVIAKKVDFAHFKQLVEENYPMPEYHKNKILMKAYYSTKTRKGVITVG